MDNGENNQPQQREERKGIIDRANSAVSNARQLRARAESIKNASKNIRRLRTAATVVRTGALAANPWFWVVVVVAIVILLLILIITSDVDMESDYEYYGALPSPAPVPGDGSTPPTTNPLPGLSLHINQPSPVSNGQEIPLTLDVSYSGSQDVEVLASIPQNTDYVRSDGSYDPSNRLVRWRLSSSTPTESSQNSSGGMSESIISLYASYGFPRPTNPETLNESEQFRWDTYLRPHAEKAAAIVGVDIGFIGMWALLENRITTYMDNCLDDEFDPNTYCSGWGGNWQVGYGMHPAYEYVYVQEAIDHMHPGKTIKQIGDQVIQESKIQEKYVPGSIIPFAPITNPSSFPDITLNDILTGANNGDSEKRHLLGILLKDDAIGAYLLAKKFRSYVDSNDTFSVANRMEGWDTNNGYYDRQKISNYIAGIYNSGIIINKYRFSFTVIPTTDDFKISGYTVSARYITNSNRNEQ